MSTSGLSSARPLPIGSTASPGPAAYLVSSTMKSKKGFTFGKRLASKSNDNPGPGSYITSDDRDTAPLRSRHSQGNLGGTTPRTLGTAARALGTNWGDSKDNGPAVGAYTPTPASTGRSFSMGGRLREKVPDGPGPGAYNSESARSSRDGGARAFTMGSRSTSLERAARKLGIPWGEKGTNSEPGPGDYYDEARNSKTKGKAFSMGRRIEQPIRKTPGPGEYTVSPQRSTAGGLISRPTSAPPRLRGRSPARNMSHTRSSQEFRLYNVHEGRPLPGIGSSSPGPASYEVKPARSGPSFSLSPRIERPIERTPGPGQYDVSPRTDSESPRRRDSSPLRGHMGLGGHNLAAAAAQCGTPWSRKPSPGPGNYDVDRFDSVVGRRSPSYSLGSRRPERIDPTPGPAAYDPNSGATVRSPRSPTVKMVKPVRSEGDRIGRGAANMGTGWPTRRSSTPGPGAYEWDRDDGFGSDDQLPTARSGNISSRSLTARSRSVTPTRRRGGPSYSFGARREQKAQDTPGPGSYFQTVSHPKSVASKSAGKVMSDIAAYRMLSEISRSVPANSPRSRRRPRQPQRPAWH